MNSKSLPHLATLIALVLTSTSVTAQDVAGGSGRTLMDIPYVEGGGHKQQLDLYTPGVHDFPTILFVHEGSLTSGDRKDEPYERMCEVFRSEGIGCAKTSYRLTPETTWPAQPEDVAAALAWLESHIGEYGGDPTRLFLFGHSSGCLLSALVASDAKYLERHGLSQMDVAGVVPMGCRLNNVLNVGSEPPAGYENYGIPPGAEQEYVDRSDVYTSFDQVNDAVPANHVDEYLPPTLVLIAEGERFFPPVLRDAAEFVGRALSAGADADLAVLPDRRHITSIRMMTSEKDPTVRLVAGFVKAH